MALVGYARISTTEQNIDRQIQALEDAGCEKIYREKKSGIDANRPELKECLNYLREGDVLVITRLDRLARSVMHLHQIVKGLDDKGVSFKCIHQAIDLTDEFGRLQFNILAAFAEFEHSIRATRQKEGIEKAREKGVQFGKKAVMKKDEVEQMARDREAGDTVPVIMRRYGISKATVYRYLDKLKREQAGEKVYW